MPRPMAWEQPGAGRKVKTEPKTKEAVTSRTSTDKPLGQAGALRSPAALKRLLLVWQVATCSKQCVVGRLCRALQGAH